MKFFFLLLIVSQVRSNDDLLKPCNFDDLTDAVSAYSRATTVSCKNKIAFHACQSKLQNNTELTPKCHANLGPFKYDFKNLYVQRSKEIVKKEFEEFKRLAQLPRVVFLFTVTGRSVRQIFRLLKAIYNEHHFYYFHVDEKSSFLKRQLQEIDWLNNYHVADWSMATIWGGASLLQVHLKVMKELYEFKRSGKWDWDFMLNLSESDYPIKYIFQVFSFYLIYNFFYLI